MHSKRAVIGHTRSGLTGTTGSPRATLRRTAALLACVALLGACGKQGATLGDGSSEVTGSAGPAGANKANRELMKCDAPIATLALMENPNGYTVTSGSNGLPNSPLPLVRLLAQQSGCFRVVDRNSGLRATIKEQELKDSGILRKEGNTVQKGKGYEAQYTLIPSLTFSEQDAGRQVGGILAMIPVLNKFVGAAEHVKLKEAQVALLLTDNETTEQVAAATGSVRVTDLGMGGLVLGKLGGAAGAGWANSNEGKVVAAAFLDAHNQLVVQARMLEAKDLPAPVPTRKAGSGKPAAGGAS
ncbi:MAG: CsgG/HfaB family protein [Burkholderiaceae bacterium]